MTEEELLNDIKRAKEIFKKSDLLTKKSRFFLIGTLIMMVCVWITSLPINLIFLVIEIVLGAIGVFYARRAYKILEDI